MLEPQQQFVRSSRQVSANLAEEKALLDLDSGVYFGINKTGSFIWDMLEERRSLEELATGVTERFEIDGSRALKDTEAFLEALLSAGLARSVERDAG